MTLADLLRDPAQMLCGVHLCSDPWSRFPVGVETDRGPLYPGVTLQEVGKLEAGRGGGGRRIRRPCFLSQLGQASWGSVYKVGLCGRRGRRTAGSLVPSQAVATVPERSHVSFLTKLGQGPQE